MGKLQQHSSAPAAVDSPIESSAVNKQLVRILASERFQRSQRLSQFLQFVVQETLADRVDFIKARTVAIHVFDRDFADNPENDPIVRIHAGRLRRALTQYYENEGSQDEVCIEIPKGGYVPVFSALTVTETSGDGASSHAASKSDVGKPRIAVLPLVNLSDSSEYEYFADGIGEELSTQLARFQDLAVLAYWTTSQIRGESRDVLKTGQDLAVDFIVCGSVTRSENHVRVSIQCAHVKTGDQIWAQRFDRQLTTDALFAIQDDIVQQVVACIGGYYGTVQQTLFQASRGKQVTELSAYEAVLANHYYLRNLDQDTHDRTRSALEQAVAVEPTYALAWAMLGALYCDIHAYAMSDLDDPLARAEDCSNRALTLDQNCQHAHYTAALVAVLSQDRPRIIAACENIVSLNPNAAFMVGAASLWLAAAGRFDDAIPLFDRSLNLNPYHPRWFHFLPWLHAFTEQDYERALAAAHRFNMPTFFWDPLLRAACLGKLDRLQEAAAAYQELIRMQPDFGDRLDHYVGCYVHSDDTRTDVIDGLRKASQ